MKDFRGNQRIHYFKATWTEAWNYCALYDMQLVTIDTSTRQACLTKFLRGLKKNKNKIWWLNINQITTPSSTLSTGRQERMELLRETGSGAMERQVSTYKKPIGRAAS
jgi:hypothetical protein